MANSERRPVVRLQVVQGTLVDGEYDCTTCGACCVNSFPESLKPDSHWNEYAEVELSDEGGMRPETLEHYTHEVDSPWGGRTRFMNMTTPSRRAPSRCEALDGDVGVQCRCSIYDERPMVCSSYVRGGSECQRARRRSARVGLVSLVDKRGGARRG